MVLIIESIVLCLLFTIGVGTKVKDPISALYDYPPKIQNKVKSLEQYKDKIPTQKQRLSSKLLAALCILLVFSLILKFVNGYNTFYEAFGYGYLLWTIINLYDLVVLDIIWFCHDPRFVLLGTEDMVKEYHNYWFHTRGFLIGEILGLVICALAGMLVQIL